MHRHEVDDLRGRLTNFAAIGLAAAAVENVLDGENAIGDRRITIELMLDEMWRLHRRPPRRGMRVVTERERDALPSARLYRHTPALLEHMSASGCCSAGRCRAHRLADGVYANLLFAVWLLDGTERVLNPGKPPHAPGDIAETNWTALIDGLELLAGAARDPAGAHDWQRRAVRRLADEHPARPGDVVGIPLGKAYFGVARAERDPSELIPLPASATGYRLSVESVADALTDHATIALATAALERLVTQVPAPPRLREFVSELVDDLWSWQVDPSTDAPAGLPPEHTGAFPSYRFHRRVGPLRELAAMHRAPAVFVDAVSSALGICAWLMDGLERGAIPGLPFVLDDEVDERGWDQLVDALSSAAQASADPDAMLSWERVTIRRLRWHHPARVGEASEPVSREAFRRATRWPG